jgi:hypothetical protein
MKMIKALSLTTVVTSLAFVSPTFADEQKNKFESGELRGIRNISQSILKVRGQKRQQVLVETQSLRDEVKQIRNELKQAVVINKPSMVINDNTFSAPPVSLDIPSSSSIDGVKRWWRSMLKNNDVANKEVANEIASALLLKDESMQMVQLRKAKVILEKRKQIIDKEIPSFWQFGQSADEKQVRIHQALVSLESDIDEAGKAKGLVRREKLQAIIAKLDAKITQKVTEQPIVPEPTITSITKHYRK